MRPNLFESSEDERRLMIGHKPAVHVDAVYCPLFISVTLCTTGSSRRATTSATSAAACKALVNVRSKGHVLIVTAPLLWLRDAELVLFASTSLD